ncbi:hypothetical protein N7519_009959 [Penicillium mononematosum]|uniref:uncharacterized protein n=1 Tax=Penicillium mononematosum TaxID=268346 RepID=UPI0025484607|nr:uncharacterized protein N7519_009959 [Penicillium mononematosum]KAJ6179498.1 hypothetical protein N7519_009959 [Penicillium mononematosum]
MTIGSFPTLSSQTLITLDLQPASTDRITTTKLPAKKSQSEVSDPVGMDGKERQPNKDYNGKKRMSHWPVVLQNSGYGACKATNMLWTALDADQWRDSTHPATHPADFLPPRGNFLPALDNQGVAQPTLSLAGVARRKQPRKNLLIGRNALSEELPFWTNSSSQ